MVGIQIYTVLLKINLRCPDTDTGGIVLTSRVVPTVPTIWAPPSRVEAIMGRLLATNVAELPDPAACNVISPEPEGVGEPSRLSDSGVIRPDIPTWLGDEGALRLEREKNKLKFWWMRYSEDLNTDHFNTNLLKLGFQMVRNSNGTATLVRILKWLVALFGYNLIALQSSQKIFVYFNTK